MIAPRRHAALTLSLRFALSTVLVVLAFFIRQALDQHYGIVLPPFITFYPAVMVVALLCGLRPGLFATLLATLLTDFYILPPTYSLLIARPSDAVALAIFFFICIFITLVCDRARHYQLQIAVFEREQELRESRDLLHLFIQNAMMPVAMFDEQMRYLAASRRWIENYKLEGRPLQGLSYYAVFPEIDERWKSAHRRGLAGETVTCEEDRFARADGNMQWLRWEVRPWFKWDKSVGGILIFTEDITAIKHSQDALRLSEARYRNLFETCQDGIAINRQCDGVILDANPAFLKITGFSRAELLGKTSLSLGLWADAQDRRKLARCLSEFSYCGDMEARFCRKTGEERWGTLSASQIEIDGQTHIFTILRDITDAKAAQDEIHQLAFYDPLTGLANRRLLMEQLRKSIALSERSNHKRALLFVDMDDFKALNDSRGHQMGDILLREVALRLLHSVREADTVSRLGGDEFLILLEELSESTAEATLDAVAIAEKILAHIREPFQLEKQPWMSSCSIGITLFGGSHEDLNALLRQSDKAMYLAKDKGGNSICLYEQDLDLPANGLQKDLIRCGAISRSS